MEVLNFGEKRKSKLRQLIEEYSIMDMQDISEFVKMLTAETIAATDIPCCGDCEVVHMPTSPQSINTEDRNEVPSLWRLFLVYLLIGISGFGPTLASETQKRIVRENKWIHEEDFLNGLALAQLLPGATYVSLTSYIGYKIRGLAGAATCFSALLLPPFCLMLMFSYVYFTFGSLPQVNIFFKGLAVVVVALVTHAVIKIGKSAITDFKGLLLALAAAAFLSIYPNVFMLLFLGSVAGVLIYHRLLRTVTGADCGANGSFNKAFSRSRLLGLIGLLALFFILAVLNPILFKLGWVFFRMGAVLFGGGFSMIPFIEQEVVRNYQWLTQDQFIVGIALGQVTPGPVLITATFVGYKVADFSGAIAATLGMFLPSLLLVITIAEIHQKIRCNIWVKSAIKGVVASFTGMIAVVAIGLARYSLTDASSVFIAIASFLMLRYGKPDTVWVVALGSCLYWLIKMTF